MLKCLAPPLHYKFLEVIVWFHRILSQVDILPPALLLGYHLFADNSGPLFLQWLLLSYACFVVVVFRRILYFFYKNVTTQP